MNRTLLRRTVLRRLTRHRLRSALAGAGVALGVLVTVVVHSAGGALRAKFVGFLDAAYPADGVVVYAGGGPMSSGGPRRLTVADVEAVAAATGAVAWDPLVYAGPRDVRVAGETLRVPVMGLSAEGAFVRRRGVVEGDYLSGSEVRGRAAVALVGATAAERLFAGESPVGRRLFVGGVDFEIRGVLERRGSDPHGGDQDFVVVVPYTTLLERILKGTEITAAALRYDDPRRAEVAGEEAVALLRREHGIVPGQSDDFAVFTGASMRAFFDRSFRAFELFAPLVSGTLYLVAALVVLGVSLSAMRARRAEIGLRKAVGARPGDVESQIVLEVLAVVAAATAVGLALVPLVLTLLEPAMARQFGVAELRPATAPAVAAVAAAALAGLAGALLPARRAARLDAAAALR